MLTLMLGEHYGSDLNLPKADAYDVENSGSPTCDSNTRHVILKWVFTIKNNPRYKMQVIWER